MSNITIDNIKTWRDWGMVLMPCEDKKPLTKKGEWSVDWTEQELLNAKRVALLHQPQKKDAIGKTYLTIALKSGSSSKLLIRQRSNFVLALSSWN